jgi:phage baseplate assembly protein W|tara:strand:- start:800 stop:1189 length:390 start_codon:yes stop_codon:yes gene_type:complete
MPGLAARLPLLISESEGPYDLLQTIKEVAAQNLKMVIFTAPGERIMDINFGVGIRRYLFRQNVTQTHDVLVNRIREQVAIYLPYIKIMDLQVDSPISNPSMPENLMALRLVYKIDPYDQTDVLELSISA